MSSFDKMLLDRGAVYGDYAKQAECAQNIKKAIWFAESDHDLEPYHFETLDMIATKISRIVCGDPNHADSWLDIAGYATKAHEALLASRESRESESAMLVATSRSEPEEGMSGCHTDTSVTHTFQDTLDFG